MGGSGGRGLWWGGWRARALRGGGGIQGGGKKKINFNYNDDLDIMAGKDEKTVGEVSTSALKTCLTEKQIERLAKLEFLRAKAKESKKAKKGRNMRLNFVSMMQ